MISIVAALLLSQVAVQDEGVYKGSVGTLNCVGGGITCTVSGNRATLTVPLAASTPSDSTPGSSSPPLGAVGDIQVKASSVAFGAYSGGSCSAGQYVSSVSAKGVLTCATPPGSYTLPAATTSTLGGVVLSDTPASAGSPKVPVYSNLSGWSLADGGTTHTIYSGNDHSYILKPSTTVGRSLFTFSPTGADFNLGGDGTISGGAISYLVRGNPYSGGNAVMDVQHSNTSAANANLMRWRGLGAEYVMLIDSSGKLTLPRTDSGTGISFTSNGTKLDLGAGTNDYLYSDGTKILTPGAITATGGFNGTATAASAIATTGTTFQFWRGDNTWAVPPAGGGGSPGGAANDLQINNGAGGFGAYLGTGSPAANQWLKSLSSTGSATWAQPSISHLSNPTGDLTFTFPSGAKQLWTFTGSTDNAFSIHGDGAFTGVGDLVHIHKTGTGSTAGADALHVEVDTDTTMTGLRVTMPGATNDAINTNGKVTASGGFVGALTGNASTATALSTSGAANQFWKNGNAWGQPAFSDLSGSATTAQLPTITVAKGGSNLTTVAANQVYVGTAADTFTAKTLPTCSGATDALSFNNSTQTFGCNTITGGTPTFAGLAQGGVMYANSTTTITSNAAGTSGYALVSGGSGAPTWAKAPALYQVTADRTTTSSTGASTTDLTWSIAASATTAFDCVLVTTNSATSLTRFGINTPTSPTTVGAHFTTSSTSATAVIGGQLSGAWASTCTNCTTSVTASVLTTPITFRLAGVVINGANSGNVTIYFANSTNGQTNVLKKGSYCEVTTL